MLKEEFMQLFVSNTRSYGNYLPATGKHLTVKKEYDLYNLEEHLEGRKGLGLVPILDNNKTYWGAIDIDNHTGIEVNHELLARKIYDLGLPLIMCYSKSGGAHCYLFGKDPLPAHSVRALLAKWALDLGYQGAEVFPKQARLIKPKGSEEKQLGNWVNIPYFNTDTRCAMVYTGEDFKVLPLEEFVEFAKMCRVTQNNMDEFILVDYMEAPPCVQAMLKNGIEQGYRNEALYNITVYFRKAFPTDYRERGLNVNQTIFEKPLSFAEAKKTITSASKKEYRYKCLEEPCRGNCDSETCLKREHGISPEEAQFLDRVCMPEITEVKLYEMDPAIWEMCLNGVKITMTTSQLYNYPNFAQAVMEKLLIVLPPMKNRDWLNILAGIMHTVEKVQTPENASIPGIIKERLAEFISKADLENNGRDITDRAKLKRGLPVVQQILIKDDVSRHVVFKGSDFVTYLKRTRSEELRGSHLWNALRKYGVDHTRLRVDGKVNAVWMLPLDERNRTKLDPDYLNYDDPEQEKIETKGHKFKTEY